MIRRGSRYVFDNPGLSHANDAKLRGYYPDLRPEEATMEDHPNHHIHELREGL